MITIAIVEDDNEYRQQYREYLGKMETQLGESFQIREFTDGDGIYPQSKPDYETAFVFLEKTAKMDMVPDWAYKLVVPAKTGKQEGAL